MDFKIFKEAVIKLIKLIFYKILKDLLIFFFNVIYKFTFNGKYLKIFGFINFSQIPILGQLIFGIFVRHGYFTQKDPQRALD